MKHLPMSSREKLFYFFRKDVSRKKYFTYPRRALQNYLCMQDEGRIISIKEDNLMFVYKRIFPPRVDPLSSWLGRQVGRKKVASIWLKIGQRTAYGQALIATRGFCYGQTMLIKLSQILGQ